MAKYLRYMGEFLSRAGVVWRVEILQESAQPFEKIGSLTFEADEALVIEWGHVDKESVICGSTATLHIESPGDRTYEDLYTIAPGHIRMDVYRNNSLYWSGTLDPEFYEEPYERAANYPVTLTFSDFGVLDRLKYDLSGMRSLYNIVDYCMGRTGINTIIDESLISTRVVPEGDKMSLGDLKVRSDNFYDEDGEASTLREVLEGILQPLALRLVQRAGRIYVYDFNALYHSAPSTPVVWDGSSQTMGTDKVYNNVKITWSPYAQSGNLYTDKCYTGEVDENLNALTSLYGGSVGDAKIFSYPTVYTEGGIDPYDVGFSIWLSDNGENAEIREPDAKFYKIVPGYDGQESEGIALCWPGIGYRPGVNTFWTYSFNGMDKMSLNAGAYPPRVGDIIFKTNEIDLPKVAQSYRPLLRRDLGLRITLDMLMDGRFNPFENCFINYEPGNKPSGQNHEWFQSWWSVYGNFVYVPVTIQYRDNATGELYIWTNCDYVSNNPNNPAVPYLSQTYGKWVKNTGSEDYPSEIGFLAYYKPEDRVTGAAAGVEGWRTNRQAIPPTSGQLGLSVTKAKDGQYIPYPNFGKEGGRLWLEVRTKGWVIVDGGHGSLSDFNLPIQINNFQVCSNDIYNFFKYNKFNWLLLKLPKIEILNIGSLVTPVNNDDVEYSAEINAYAKEDLELDTICGSSRNGVPLARGAYFLSETGEQVTVLTRAGRTTQIEELLIGTMFSQFGERRTTLSGEMQIANDCLCTYQEDNQEGKIFMITADTQNVIADVSDVTITELRPDEYERRN